MNDHPAIWVLGDHAMHPEAPDDAIRLTLGGRSDSMALKIEGLEGALSAGLPPSFHDLLRISTFAFAADSAVSRGRLDDDGNLWHRNFRIVLGVDDPDFWNQPNVKNPIEQTLGFISQDTFQFDFQLRKNKPPRQLTLSGPKGGSLVSWEKISDVALFSGGLDSFAGAADLILRQRRGVALVSYQSSTKIAAAQDALFQDLKRKAKEHGVPEPVHVVVELKKHTDGLRNERTNRSRSFLYASVAGAVAKLIQRDRVTAPESGIIGMNLPVAHSVVGARGTRTAHPRALVGFGRILSAVAGYAINVHNPFALMTRAEVIQKIADSSAIDLAKHTISCARVHRISEQHPHCGTCSQCIDRQFGFLASGLQDHDSALGYRVRLAQDEWKRPNERDLLLNWIHTASKFADFTSADEFVASNGDAARSVPFIMASESMGPEEAQQAVFELHRRHGLQVLAALDRLKSSAQSHKGSTLMSMVWGARSEPRASFLKDAGIDNRLAFDGIEWKVLFRNGSVSSLPDSLGIQYLSHLLACPGKVFVAANLHDICRGQQPSSQPPLNDRGRDVIRRHIGTFEDERTTAQEVGDDEDAARCQAEIDILTELLCRSSHTGQQQDVTGASVEHEIRAFIKDLEATYPPLAAHFREHLTIGPVLWYRHTARWIVKPRPTIAETPAAEWVPASELVDADIHELRTARDVSRFCERLGVATRHAKTKTGDDHPQRRLVHRPSFDAAMARFEREKRNLQDAADRALTVRRLPGHAQ